MKFPKHYSLVDHNDTHYTIHDSRDNKQFKVARKPLHPAHRENILKLQKFDEGGKVAVPTQDTSQPKPTINEKHMGNNAGSGASSVSDALSKLAHPWAKGGEIQKLSDGGAPEALSSQENTGPTQALMSGQVSAPQSGASGSWEDPNSSQGAATPPQPPTIADKFKTNADAQEQALASKAGAEAGQGNAEAKNYQESINLAQDVFKKSQQELWNQGVENDNLMQEVASSKIDPQQFFHNMGTGQKIGTALALVLGGVGSGLTGGPNIAHEMLKDAVNKDIESQKINLGKKESLLGRNLEKYRDMTLAQHATTAQLNSIIQGKLAQTAAKFGGQINSLNTQSTLGKLQNENLMSGMEMNKLLQQQRMKEALMGSDVSQLNPLDFVQHVVPADKQKDVAHELGQSMSVKEKTQYLTDLYKKAMDEQTLVRRAGGLRGESPALLNLKNEMLPLIKDKEGRVNEFEQQTVNNVLPGMGSTDAREKDLLAGFSNFLKGKENAPLSKTYGIDINRFNSTKPSAPYNPMDGQTAVNKAGQRIVLKNGQWMPIK